MKKSHRALACRGLIAATLAFGSLPYAHAGWCDRVQGTGAKLAAAAATVTATVGGALKLTGVGAVVHSSGAMIVSTASGGYVAGTLGVLGTATAVVTATSSRGSGPRSIQPRARGAVARVSARATYQTEFQAQLKMTPRL